MLISIIRRALGSLLLATGLLMAQSATAATGLSGKYYTTNVDLANLAQAEAWISTHTPAVTFTANVVCFPECHDTDSDSMTLNQFLSSNATNISANSIGDIDHHIMVIDGFITFASSGSKEFWLRSDDGASLQVGSFSLISDFPHSLSSVIASQYFAAGTYAIRIVQFENSGETGLTVKVNGSPNQTYTHFPPVPEPGTWGMMIGGLALVGFAIRRRKVDMAFA